MRMSKNVARRSDEEDRDHHAHSRGQSGIHAGRSLHSLNIQAGENQGKEDRPSA